MARTPSGEVFVATSEGLRAIDRVSLEKDSVNLVPIPSPYRAVAGIRCNFILMDVEDNLWLTTAKQIVKVDRRGVLTTIDATGDPPVGAINSVFRDREGNIWLTKTQDGIARLQSQEVQFYAANQQDFTV